MTLHFHDLTPEQQDFLTDDCGNYFLDVPDFMWTDACREHDFEYWLGHTKEHRKEADKKWLNAMYKAVDKVDSTNLNHSPMIYKAIAFVYYLAVRLFSGKFFYYGDRHKTLADLESEMRDAQV